MREYRGALTAFLFDFFFAYFFYLLCVCCLPPRTATTKAKEIVGFFLHISPFGCRQASSKTHAWRAPHKEDENNKQRTNDSRIMMIVLLTKLWICVAVGSSLVTQLRPVQSESRPHPIHNLLWIWWNQCLAPRTTHHCRARCHSHRSLKFKLQHKNNKIVSFTWIVRYNALRWDRSQAHKHRRGWRPIAYNRDDDVQIQNANKMHTIAVRWRLNINLLVVIVAGLRMDGANKCTTFGAMQKGQNNTPSTQKRQSARSQNQLYKRKC